MTTSSNYYSRSIDAELTDREAQCTGDEPRGECVALAYRWPSSWWCWL